jgi:hypothetical protein
MEANSQTRWRISATGGAVGLLGALILVTFLTPNSEAGILQWWRSHRTCGDIEPSGELGGTWYWLRSPEEEKCVIISLYSRYCIRCHGVDGRGIWGIPGVPNFTNARWQASRSDAQLARVIIEGRGACMPPFRGTLTTEEAWAMGRYLRTLVPGTEISRPDFTTQPEMLPPPRK